MAGKDFETDRGSGAVITALAVLALVAMATLYMLFPVDRGGGKDTPQAKIGQTATESGTTGQSRPQP
ncbi:hypothetical protein [Bradyrhizobium sp. LHD-71]|uniref:hypothetical protein n=1 Tax=Bradyrhizobium sp. LHD-71 TaxID=3072141 RepID=UPI00280E13DC|nr:hypothetical protein [Bradyrhizobium sp. LHD-71]MDQ8730345.1 hypothetical protein [Bradyrhizobium sp. LHD-71]